MTEVTPATAFAGTAASHLLGWYDRHARKMPWRTGPAEKRSGVRPDPYHVWLSEVMLQQTQVKTVRDYFLRFVRLWPTVEALAKAESDDVMRAWAGLGYYSRARNLKKCAEVVWREHGGKFAQEINALEALPGIGEYTANAIAAIAYDHPEAVVVDGNVERVIARLNRIATPLAQAKTEIRALAAELTPEHRTGDFAQAMMDLGATICTPKNPACPLCPLNKDCQAQLHGDPLNYPVKAAKQAKPKRRGAAFVALRNDGSVLLRRRAESGLLGGMTEVPTTGWTARRDGETGAQAAPFAADWRRRGSIRHVFTHFELELEVWLAEGLDGTQPDEAAWWSPPGRLTDEALPSVMKKVIGAAIEGTF